MGPRIELKSDFWRIFCLSSNLTIWRTFAGIFRKDKLIEEYAWLCLGASCWSRHWTIHTFIRRCQKRALRSESFYSILTSVETSEGNRKETSCRKSSSKNSTNFRRYLITIWQNRSNKSWSRWWDSRVIVFRCWWFRILQYNKWDEILLRSARGMLRKKINLSFVRTLSQNWWCHPNPKVITKIIPW